MSQNQTQTTYIPKFAYPFKDVNNINTYNEKLSSTPKGNYLFTKQGVWHGAPHFYGTNFDSKIQVIADGELVAYRLNSKYLKNSDAQEGKGFYSTGFFLVRHKLGYPTNNKLTFFSLYMHTAKKDAYNIIQNQTNQSNTTNYYTVKKGDTLGKIAKEHHTTVDKLRQDNNIADVNKIREGHVLIIKTNNHNPSSQTSQPTPSNSNPNSNPNFIVENPLFDEVVVLPTPKKIKAGEVIGLMGEYNQQKESDNKVLHLEVFANEEFKTFVQTAQRGDKNLPQSFNWARVIEIDSKDNVSIFENIEVLYENNTNEELKLNQSFKELFNLIDDDQNGQMEPQELIEAAKNPLVKKVTNNYIVKHSSEWDKTQNMAEKFKELVNINKNTISNAEKLLKHYENEKERIYNLSFFEECKGIQGFPQSDMVYVMNVIGLVGAFSDCRITVEQLKQIFTNATKTQLEGVCEEINKNCSKYQLDSTLKRSHFFAQIYGETGSSMKPVNESWEYSPEALKSFSKYYREHPKEALDDGYLKINGKIIRSANQENIGKKHFSKLNGNRAEFPEDGYAFRGRGLIQLTGYEKYSKFKEDYNLYWDGTPPDTINNPDIINEFPYSIRSAIWFWAFYSKAYSVAISEQDSTIVKITALINGGNTGIDDRKKGFNLSYGVFK